MFKKWFQSKSQNAIFLPLEDYGKLARVKALLDEGRSIVKFIGGHHRSLAMWREIATRELLFPGETRFMTQFICAQSLLREKDAAIELVNDRRFVAWLQGKTYKTAGLEMRARINDDAWWAKYDAVVGAVEPIIKLLRDGDGSKPIMGKVYVRMGDAIKTVEQDTTMHAQDRRDLVKILNERWVYLHNAFHSAGYALDPEFHDHSHHTSSEIMSDLRTVIRRHFYDDEPAARAAIMQFAAYKNKRFSAFTEPGVFAIAAQIPGWEWWQTFGAEAPQLQSVAMKVLSKRSAASSCEHLWSKFRAIWTDARSSLGARKAIRLLKLACNLHLARKATDLSIDAQLIGWQEEPAESDDEAETQLA